MSHLEGEEDVGAGAELAPIVAELKTRKTPEGKDVLCRKVPTFGVAFRIACVKISIVAPFKAATLAS